MEIKDQIVNEIEDRILRLKEHAYDEKDDEGNQYAQLNHALSRVISVSLQKELENLNEFVKSVE